MGHTIAIVGVSGVGKSTFITSLQNSQNFQYLSASDLIKDEKKIQSQQNISNDELRHVDIDDNQQLLISGFLRARDSAAEIIVLDGHTIVDTPNGLVEIPAEVFRSVEVSKFIFLIEAAEIIAERRASDGSRKRPNLPIKEIQRHQNHALAITAKIALKLRIPLILITSDQIEFAKQEIR